MSVVVLKDLLLEQGQIDRYFEGSVPVDLWRALKKSQKGGIFDFVEQEYTLSNGRPRPADITIVDRRGEKWVEVRQRPRGLSTFDVLGAPPGDGWNYYRIPAGTVLPAGLCIVRDEFNPRYNATHHTIAPACDMPLATFKKLLVDLAALVVKEAA